MAQIDLETIKHIDKDRNSIHAKVHTTYTVFEVDGEKYFSLIRMAKVSVRCLKKLVKRFS
mgnify:CR=1 FL=1